MTHSHKKELTISLSSATMKDDILKKLDNARSKLSQKPKAERPSLQGCKAWKASLRYQQKEQKI
jgi:hypothetical protein